MKNFLSWFIVIVPIILGWFIILPFAILALPYLWLTHIVEVDSKGYRTVLDFFTSFKGIPSWCES